MPIYTGFSTQGVNQPRTIETTGAYGGSGTLTTQPRLVKKFTLTDSNLVVRDLINALSIKQGDKVGQPTYGTTLWSYLFEPNTGEVRAAMEEEIRRVIAQDPRVILNDISINSQENGILFEIQVAFDPFNQPMTLSLQMNKDSGMVKLMPGV
jgi:phage baseplate assembly protein W